MTPTWFDRTLAHVAPKVALRRYAARRAFETLASYEGARNDRRTSGWAATGNSANAEIGSGIVKLRDRAREQVRNNPHAAQAVAVWESSVVGAGITGRARHSDQRIADAANAAWESWWPNCSANGLPSFAEVQRQACRAVFESGEVYFRLRYRRYSDGLRIPLQVEVLEADYCDLDKSGDVDSQGFVLQGVEFNRIGRRVAYWMFGQHPGEVAVTRRGMSLMSARIPASEIVHVYEAHRPGQVHGVTRFAPVLLGSRDLADYEDAVRVQKKVASCLVGVFTSPETEGETFSAQVLDSDGSPIETMRPGMLLKGRPGEDVKFSSVPSSGGEREWKIGELLDYAAGLQIPYELLTGDYSRSNYSSSRMGMVAFKRIVESAQWNVMVPMVCEPMWRAVMDLGQTMGLIPMSAEPIRAEWGVPPFALLDRKEEAAADEIELRLGTKTWPQHVQAVGEDPERQISEIAEWRQRLEAAGVSFGAQPAKVSPDKSLEKGAAV